MPPVARNVAKFPPSPPGPIIDVSVTSGTRHYTLLNTNEPPEDSELTFIRSVVSETSMRLAGLDDEISNLREKLEQLEDQRATLSSYRTQNMAIVSPLRRMPLEVLADIFSWTLPSLHDACSFGGPDVAQSPWLLTQISSRWRALALSTPSLWTRVVIDYTCASAPVMAVVEAQIHLAKKLNIHFYGHPKTESGPQLQMFELLTKHSLRWEELCIGITSEMVPLLTAFRDRIPSLKRFWVQWEDSHTAVQSLDCFQTAPSLVDFGINHEEHHFVPITVPVQQLTRYQLTGSWRRHLTILKLAQNLVEAHIEIDFNDEELEPPKAGLINLPHLRRLFVSHSEVLDNLELHGLEGLALWVHEEQADDIVHHFESFFSHSECPLRRLCLRGSDAHATAQILGKIPSVAELALAVNETHSQGDFDLFMSTLSSSEIAPQLHSLFFASEAGSIIDDYTAYLKMLRTRWEADGSALKNAALLAVAEGSGPDLDTLGGLHALRLEGLDLLILEGSAASKEMFNWLYSSSWIL
ncbi:hypothetical protein MSAN_00749800 [Mycena sanguinolenta]|uniref:F-box domain-containing protein n=1 Tax=Mycena sanguinolenta TaxID=230812 RepID=A0A8H6Z543_9AGAR|nr:hypothetical protein MSAN_00749800 [Mycena sanguinolenta]